ncbi:hypothetical protein CEXT_543651 [Caerostris extrusa]|uniref:Uncharacterized protein n=1 Tax=Caerostris extrusa TaxID=172846 RepID=A0AAV4R3L7_CAEEX|nr:hypothetical protein CEXT_543651 [Caerostris extrusa]
MQPELRQIFSQDSRENPSSGEESPNFTILPASFLRLRRGMLDAPHFNFQNIKCNAMERGGTMLFAFMSPEVIHLGFKQIRGEFHWKKKGLRSLQL